MTNWLPQRKSDKAALPLVCFPFAGGGTAVYHQWQMDPRIELLPVRLPGREGRFNEPAYEDAGALVESLLADLAGLWSSRFALFGYSMGALIAWELARRTTAMGRPPICLFVSACRAPARLRQAPSPPLYELPDEEMIDSLIGRYGMRVEPGERALMRVLSDTIRADLKLLDSFDLAPAVETVRDGRLACPVFACGGADDPMVTRTDLVGWQVTTDGPFAVRVFPGGHFFLRTHHKPLGNFVQQKLLDLITR